MLTVAEHDRQLPINERSVLAPTSNSKWLNDEFGFNKKGFLFYLTFLTFLLIWSIKFHKVHCQVKVLYRLENFKLTNWNDCKYRSPCLANQIQTKVILKLLNKLTFWISLLFLYFRPEKFLKMENGKEGINSGEESMSTVEKTREKSQFDGAQVKENITASKAGTSKQW